MSDELEQIEQPGERPDEQPDGIEPEDNPEYVARRLMAIEAAIYRGPMMLAEYRNAEMVAQERHDEAKAHALAEVIAEHGKLTAAERDAQVFTRTTAERRALAVAKARYEYAKDVNRALDREKDALQTRSANMREQMKMAGRGHA
ncbi:hypothetical protein SEA_SCHMIDT_43 [Gordonia phage Schmidt]|uniref:Uncharacterized protein n=1 Tax=Gordonia phage Schmidt TaxID=2301697 RepID=A0A385E2R0_9CAUD|nr:hypothetical protein KDJ59_gp43 [Gordonia phage Schmidt]AXQ65165.1 hypothetical protein SEA_SCHMIDT_43 [Gordonia phage Schmidt]